MPVASFEQRVVPTSHTADSVVSERGAGPAALTAQGFCWRAQFTPACSGFLVVDFHGHYAVIENGRTEVRTFPVLGPDGDLVPGERRTHLDGYTWSLGADIGYAHNVSPSWALGGTIGIEGVEGGARTVFKARARRWLGHGFALDIEPGIFSLLDSRGRGRKVTGGLLGARLDIGGLGFLSVRWEAMDLEPDIFELGDVKEVDPGGFQHALSAGAGFGGQAGIVIFALAAVGFVVLLGTVGPIA